MDNLQINTLFSSVYSPSFGTVYVTDIKAQRVIRKNLNKKRLESLKKIMQEQQNNPVHAFISIGNGGRLQAKVFCPYRLRNFKEYYKQRPIIESYFSFLKRIVKVTDKYKMQMYTSRAK